MADDHEAKVRALAGILAASQRSGGPRAESLHDAAGGVPGDPEAIVERVAENLSGPPASATEAAAAAGGGAGGSDGEPPPPAASADDGGGEGNDPEEFAKALKILLEFGKSALGKVAAGNFALHRDERSAMEALIIADGSRPSFALQNGRHDPEDPFIGGWDAQLSATGNAMADVARAVGRIQPENGSAVAYFGSGTLVDAAKGLVLTNFHVIDQAQNVHGIAMHTAGDRIVVDGHLEIDFAGEAGSLETNRFRIVEVRLPPGAGEMFDGVDAAVCRLDPKPLDAGAKMPAAVGPASDKADYANGAMPSLALIGFPGPPTMDKGDDVDWDFVIRTLFRNRFGIKRLSPGRFSRRLGSHPLDRPAKRAIGHDATTFGGASGSLVCAWLDTGAPAFALHFAGETIETNYALAFAKARSLLEPLGVPFG